MFLLSKVDALKEYDEETAKYSKGNDFMAKEEWDES